jgi:CO/xanthine dehydrogenase Mo-binding subunit
MADRRIGTDVRPRDAVDRVVGTLPFTIDRRVPGMAHAKAVRSTVPHGRIVEINTSDADGMPGVVAIVTGQDLLADKGIDPYFGTKRRDQPAIAIDVVRHVGEPVAVVVAETRFQAQQAADRVYVTYDPLDHVVDAVEAMQPGAPAVHEAWPDNDCGTWRLHNGDLDAGWAVAEHVYEGTYTTPPASHVPLEPHVCLAQWEDGALHVWTAAQAPHSVHAALAEMFDLDHVDVRIEVANLGGAFGSKGQVKIEPMVACAARIAGRPVRMELDRDEVFFTVGRHAARVHLRTGVRSDGTIVVRAMDVVYNAGAYAVTSPTAAGQALVRAPGPYRIPAIEVTSTARYTNTVPTGPFRGAMTAQVCFAYESQLDEIAADLDIDALELRHRNLLRDGDAYATGEVMHDVHFAELVDDAAAAVGWGRPRPPTPRGIARGRGVGVMLKSTITPSRSEAMLELRPDGGVRVLTSSVEMGQGATTTLLQLVADDLQIDPDDVEIPFPDTASTPFDTTTSSSRTTFSMGAALGDAAAQLRRELSAIAAAQFGWEAADVVHADGTVSAGGARVGYGRLLKEAGRESLVVRGVFQSEGGLAAMDPDDVHGRATVHWHQGAAGAEVEVDLETGRVTVVHAHGSCWAGRVVNPFRVQQQNQGCLVYGLGPALFEESVYDDGQLVNPNLSDYMIPSILDVPTRLTSTALESDAPDAEMHGVGEMALPGLAPAIANAVFDATGVRVTDLPLTPERVLRALRGEEA